MHLTLNCGSLLLLLLLGFNPAQSRYIKNFFKQSSEETDNNIDTDDLSVFSIIERANKHAGQALGAPDVKFGDIAVKTGFKNADPCTARGCKWIKQSNGNVNVPFIISNQFSARERGVIQSAMRSFESSTCIRFIPRTTRDRDYIIIQSLDGCFSFVGRRGGGQAVSLSRNGCVFLGVAQHELLHALGFNHEQTRSDRDNHVRILFQNIIQGQEHNFRKINTINLNTPYDYGSVMHYGRFAFSRNREPTIVPIPNSNVEIGRATQMSRIDIQRVNTLYCQ